MARFTFNLPDIGEGISEAEIVNWHVAVDDIVKEDQPIADMMTDKATVEMESPVAGKIVAIGGEIGDRVPIGSMLVEIEMDEQGGSETSVTEEVEDAKPSVPPVIKGEEKPGLTNLSSASSPTQEDRNEASTKVLASPAVRARAKALGVDLSMVHSQGERIRHADLDAYLFYGKGEGYRAPGTSPVRPDEQVKVVGLRRRIAENMAASKRHIPHFTYVEEIDVTALEFMVEVMKANLGDRARLTLLPFLIVAICKAVPDFPRSEEHTSKLQSLMRISYADFCLKKKNQI